jgi:hypothetical protein
MTVYDIVYIVPTGADASYPPGRWRVDTHDREDQARAQVDLMNDIRAPDPTRFVVEPHDEECPGRAACPRDSRETLHTPGQCRCGR